MERLTLACLRHLPTAVLFVADLTGECGTSVASQWRIRWGAKRWVCRRRWRRRGSQPTPPLDCGREELRARFPGKPWVDVLSKADLLEEEFDEADRLAGEQCGAADAAQAQRGVSTAVQFAGALPRALRVSSTSGAGVDELKVAMLAMLDEWRAGAGDEAVEEAAWSEAEAEAQLRPGAEPT